MTSRTGSPPPNAGLRPDVWREFRDPRGSSCWVYVTEIKRGTQAALFTGYIGDEWVTTPVPRLPLRWSDPRNKPDGELWADVCPAHAEFKLAEFAAADCDSELRYVLQFPEYQRVMDVEGPMGLTPLLRAVSAQSPRAAAEFIAREANPYHRCWLNPYTHTNAVELALDSPSYRRPDFPLFSVLMKYRWFKGSDVQLAHQLAESWRTFGVGAATTRAIRFIDDEMKLRKLPPLGRSQRR